MINEVIRIILVALRRVMPFLRRQDSDHRRWKRTIQSAMASLNVSKNTSPLQIDGFICAPSYVANNHAPNPWATGVLSRIAHMDFSLPHRDITHEHVEFASYEPRHVDAMPKGLFQFSHLRGFSGLSVYDGVVRAIVANKMLTLDASGQVIATQVYDNTEYGRIYCDFEEVTIGWQKSINYTYYCEYDVPRATVHTFADGKVLLYRPYIFVGNASSQNERTVINPEVNIYNNAMTESVAGFKPGWYRGLPYGTIGDDHRDFVVPFNPVCVLPMGDNLAAPMKRAYIAPRGSVSETSGPPRGIEIYSQGGSRVSILNHLVHPWLDGGTNNPVIFGESASQSRETDFYRAVHRFWQPTWRTGLVGRVVGSQMSANYQMCAIEDGMERWAAYCSRTNGLRILNAQTGETLHYYDARPLEDLLQILTGRDLEGQQGAPSNRHRNITDRGIALSADPLNPEYIYITVRDGAFKPLSLYHNRSWQLEQDLQDVHRLYRQQTADNGVYIVRCKIGG